MDEANENLNQEDLHKIAEDVKKRKSNLSLIVKSSFNTTEPKLDPSPEQVLLYVLRPAFSAVMNTVSPMLFYMSLTADENIDKAIEEYDTALNQVNIKIFGIIESRANYINFAISGPQMNPKLTIDYSDNPDAKLSAERFKNLDIYFDKSGERTLIATIQFMLGYDESSRTEDIIYISDRIDNLNTRDIVCCVYSNLDYYTAEYVALNHYLTDAVNKAVEVSTCKQLNPNTDIALIIEASIVFALMKCSYFYSDNIAFDEFSNTLMESLKKRCDNDINKSMFDLGILINYYMITGEISGTLKFIIEGKW